MGDANIGAPFLLTTFAAVILGGTPLGGGRGTLLGSVFGAFVVATLGSVLLSLSVTSYWTDIIQGTVLIIAVMVPLAASLVLADGASCHPEPVATMTLASRLRSFVVANRFTLPVYVAIVILTSSRAPSAPI